MSYITYPPSSRPPWPHNMPNHLHQNNIRSWVCVMLLLFCLLCWSTPPHLAEAKSQPLSKVLDSLPVDVTSATLKVVSEQYDKVTTQAWLRARLSQIKWLKIDLKAAEQLPRFYKAATSFQRAAKQASDTLAPLNVAKVGFVLVCLEETMSTVQHYNGVSRAIANNNARDAALEQQLQSLAQQVDDMVRLLEDMEPNLLGMLLGRVDMEHMQTRYHQITQTGRKWREDYATFNDTAAATKVHLATERSVAEEHYNSSMWWMSANTAMAVGSLAVSVAFPPAAPVALWTFASSGVATIAAGIRGHLSWKAVESADASRRYVEKREDSAAALANSVDKLLQQATAKLDAADELQQTPLSVAQMLWAVIVILVVFFTLGATVLWLLRVCFPRLYTWYMGASISEMWRMAIASVIVACFMSSLLLCAFSVNSRTANEKANVHMQQRQAAGMYEMQCNHYRLSPAQQLLHIVPLIGWEFDPHTGAIRTPECAQLLRKATNKEDVSSCVSWTRLLLEGSTRTVLALSNMALGLPPPVLAAIVSFLAWCLKEVVGRQPVAARHRMFEGASWVL